ncbi:DUF4890 domain-containing protein [Pontibacter sp. E15-1]|uniref:DUF4890 domain-containing protein n=1 Tax=Pontibacter sp. E15-1 TaxID=2919918 RepID=UPI001F4FE2C8|nr:DUF4890 domain-containing protein [Pontibacter sp. E15-1]MCJ8164798.1 DUF4890 domain-containing protein [Pontibacter sp. E15-1]
MKKTFAALVLGILVTGSTFAQQAPQQEKKARTEQHHGKHRQSSLSPEEQASRRAAKMSQELGLNKSQTKKLQALHLKQIEQREAMRAEYKNTDTQNRAQRKQEMKAAQTQWQAELKDILTQKQYAQYQEKREEMRESRRGDRPGRDGHKNRENWQQQRS